MNDQLSLFTRRKARRAPPALERATHIALADTLRVSLKPGWLWFHPANGELRDQQTANLLKRMGVTPGVSDFILAAPEGAMLHALELKRRGKKPTDAQRAFLAAVRAAGGLSAWADTYEAALAILIRWGAVRISIHNQPPGHKPLIPYAGQERE